jgi:DNA repair protein RadC
MPSSVAVDIARGTVNESPAAPGEIFRPAIVHSAYGFVLVHNHPSVTQTILKPIYKSPSA